MAYIPFDPDVPAGTDTPPIYGDDDLANIRALRDAVVCGFMPGWSYTLDTANPPMFTIWKKGAIWFRLTLTYGPGTPSYCDSAKWEYSENSGGAWTVISTGGTPCAITTNSVGSILTVDKDAGMWVLALSAFNRNRYSEYAGDEHAAGVGPEVHGLGDMSTQNPANVAITGGDIQSTKIQLAPRISPATPPLVNGSATWDWGATPTHVETPPGWVCSTIANAARGEMKRIHVTGSGSVTLPGIIYATGHPTWGTTGTLVNVICLDAATPVYLVTTIPF